MEIKNLPITRNDLSSIFKNIDILVRDEKIMLHFHYLTEFCGMSKTKAIEAIADTTFTDWKGEVYCLSYKTIENTIYPPRQKKVEEEKKGEENGK
jgi:hypothetical protein